MADIEKVIEVLKICTAPHCTCEGCPRRPTDDETDCCDDLMKDALALLKEQEAVVPYQHDAVWLCGNCEKEVVGWDDDIDGKEYRYPFCRQCGKKVKWE